MHCVFDLQRRNIFAVSTALVFARLELMKAVS